MRTLLYTALTMATFGLLASAPANATSGWSCIGPHVACGGAHSAPRKAAKAHRASHKRNYATRGKRHVAKSQARAAKSAQRADRRSAERRNKGSARTASAAGFSKAAYKGGSGHHHGIASYYWQGQQTASGARFNPNALTAAHRTLPFGTKVRVTNKRNGRSVVVTINDRGPFIRGRVIDLSSAAAGVIGMKGAGLAPVSVERVGG